MIKTLLKSVREYKIVSIITPIFVSIEVIIECIIPFIMSMLIDNMTQDNLNPILSYGLILIVLSFFSLFFGMMSARFGATASCGFAKNLREDLFFNIQEFAFSDIDLFKTSSLVTRMTTDVTNVQNAYQMIIRIAVRTPLMIIFSIFMTVKISKKMSIIFFLILPILTIGLIIIIFTAMPIFRRIFKKYDAMNSAIKENVSGIRVVKSFVREEYEKNKFNNTADDVRSNFTMAEKILAFNSPLMMFCMYSSMLLVDYFGAKLIINSMGTEFTTGELSSLIAYGVQILIAMMMLSMVFVMITMAEESARRIVEVINYKSSMKLSDNPIKNIKNGDIEFKNVFFKYKIDSNKYALSNINIKIKSGETIGIIGGTGSSKTTFVQLINRLYDTTEGEVKVADINVKNYDLYALRDSVCIVLQKNVLFSGTIKENLKLGNADATFDEIKHMCDLSCASEFIEQFPDKYDALISQGGTNVSGGQKQRICIARTLLKKPKILILDDSTSAVDTKTDAKIRKSLRDELPNMTKIIIAQRISSIEDCDKILVFDGGEIIQIGTHDELIKTPGIYKDIYESQTKKEDN